MIELRWIFWYLMNYMLMQWELWWLMLTINSLPLLVYLASPLVFGKTHWDNGLENRRIVDLAGCSALVAISVAAIYFRWGEKESLIAVQVALVLTIALLGRNLGFWLWMALNLVWMYQGHWGWMVANDLVRLGTVWWPTRLLDEHEKDERAVRRFEMTVIYAGLAISALLAVRFGLGTVTYGHTPSSQSEIATYVLPLLTWLGFILAAVFGR